MIKLTYVSNLQHTLTADRIGVTRKIWNMNQPDGDIVDLFFNMESGGKYCSELFA